MTHDVPIAEADQCRTVSDSGGMQLSANGGYVQWLSWLQRLLSANALTLLRCELTPAPSSVVPLATVPELNRPAAAVLKLATRCARSGKTARALSEVNSARSVICVPHDERGSNTRYVLLIERVTDAKMPLHTQARLVAWAFGALDQYSTPLPVHHESPLLNFSLAQRDGLIRGAPAWPSFVDCAARVFDCASCILVRLQMSRGCVSGTQLMAVSGQPELGRRTATSDALALDIQQVYQQASLPLQPEYQRSVESLMPVHSSVATPRSCGSRLIIPLQCDGRWFALVLEHAQIDAFSTAQIDKVNKDVTAALALMLLADPRRLGLGAACMRLVHRVCQAPALRVRQSIMASAAFALLMLALLYPVEHRISAPLSVEATEQHVVIAPMDGFVKSVAVKAGDSVQKDQVMATLDDRDLRFQQQVLDSKAQQIQQSYTMALASRDKVAVTRLQEEAAMNQTELTQIEVRQSRMILKAPADAVVLSGSWEDAMGAAVSAGDTLFSLGSTHHHRLVMDIDEYDVKAIRPGQTVGIRLSANPSDTLSATVSAIMPLTAAKEGLNSVQVHAVLDDPLALRPGMRGVGKVLVGHRSKLLQWLERAGARLTWLAWKFGLLA